MCLALISKDFIGHEEFIWLENCPSEYKPVLCKRYVGDVFLFFRYRSHIQLFFNHPNSRHPLLKFTHEVERDGCIFFLDVQVVKVDRGFETWPAFIRVNKYLRSLNLIATIA